MSIKGRPIVWLDRAIESGDLPGALTAAYEIPSLGLDHALAVLVLMSTDDPARFERAARRWADRWMAEKAEPRAPRQRERWVELLDELPSLEAVTTLGAVCERLGYERAQAALVHLFPRVR